MGVALPADPRHSSHSQTTPAAAPPPLHHLKGRPTMPPIDSPAPADSTTHLGGPPTVQLHATPTRVLDCEGQ